MSEYDKQQVRKAKRETEIAKRNAPSKALTFVLGGMAEKINLNDFAKNVTLKEKGKKEISIGQVKETIKHTFKELAKYNDDTILYNIRRKK